MATIEFIQKRIEGKEKEIDRLIKKQERIQKAKASNWENNPYWYTERDEASTNRELSDALQALSKYQSQLQSEKDKAASRDIPVILEFLKKWKESVTAYYIKAFGQYVKDREEFYQKEKEFSEWSYSEEARELKLNNKEEYNNRYHAHTIAKRWYQDKWKFINEYIGSKYNEVTRKYEIFLDVTKLQKDLDRDADAKYDFIIERTNEIVGQITDASNLSIGNKGDLNGVIIGTKGKASVNTIGAGGYNEDVILDSGRHGQRFHFRTLIKALASNKEEDKDV